MDHAMAIGTKHRKIRRHIVRDCDALLQGGDRLKVMRFDKAFADFAIRSWKFRSQAWQRVGKEMKILIENGSDSASPDASLVRVLVRAHMIRDRFLADKSVTLDEIAKSVDIVPSYVTRLFRLTLLAPDIVSAILGGKHPPELNARKLLDDTRLPLDWNEQRRNLGFA